MDTVSFQVNLAFRQLDEAMKLLSPAGNAKLNDAMWDESIPLPQGYKKLVSDRMKKARKHAEQLSNRYEVFKTL